MPDSITDSIDRVFDLIDKGVETADQVLNRGKQTGEQHRARQAKRQVVIDTAASVKVKVTKPETSSTVSTTAIVPRRFRLVEVVNPTSGETIFVVTDGKVRAECDTCELAERILRALEASS